MTFVINEYGEVQGIVTVRDVTEAITGEFVTEDPAMHGRCSVMMAAGCWTVIFRSWNSKIAWA